MDFDVVVIGSGVGGGAVALSLAGTGARICVIGSWVEIRL